MFVRKASCLSVFIRLQSKAIVAKSQVRFADDPYYCGMRARVPNFVKTKVKENKGPPPVMNRYSIGTSISNGHLAATHASQHNPVMWHARSYDSGMGKSPYVWM